MFDINLYEKTRLDILLVDCNGNGLPNSVVIEFNGDKNLIFRTLTEDFILEKVVLDFENSSFNELSINGDNFISETIPVMSGAESLIYHGYEKPSITNGVEWLAYDKQSKSIRISRLISSFTNKNKISYEHYFDFINHHLKDWIEDLNCAIEYHNGEVNRVATMHAESLGKLYSNHQELFRNKKS